MELKLEKDSEKEFRNARNRVVEFRDSFQKEYPGVTLIMGLGNFSHYASIATIQDDYIQTIGMCEVMKNDAMAKWNEETNRKSLT